MRFAWTDDQQAFGDAVGDLLLKECPPAVVRTAWDAPAGALDRGVWDSLDAMGVQSMLAAEPDGGLGLDATFLVPILTETGRAALPHPIVETAMVAAPLGLTGRMVATNLGGGTLVPCAADADVLLLLVDGVLTTVEPAAVTLEPVETVDRARRTARVTTAVTDADSTGRQVLADGTLVTDDPAVIDAAFDRGALGTAAQLLGLAQAMLDLTVAYVTERHQFGVPIGSFQAVKHHLANALLTIEFAAPAIARAAVTLTPRDISMAKALATTAATTTGRAALQCHGAIGYTVEHDLHLHLKRSWALTRTWGDRNFHTDRVARALHLEQR